MMHIRKCGSCGKYTFSEICKCGGKAESPRPPKYSVEDKYGEYRRTVKEEQRRKDGLL